MSSNNIKHILSPLFFLSNEYGIVLQHSYYTTPLLMEKDSAIPYRLTHEKRVNQAKCPKITNSGLDFFHRIKIVLIL